MNFIKLFQDGISNCRLWGTIVCVFLALWILAPPALAEEEQEVMILEPIVQGFASDNFVYAIPMNDTVYISPQQISEIIGMYFHENGIKSGYWNSTDRKFTIDVQNRTATFDGKVIQIDPLDFWEQDGQYFFRTFFYEKLFPLSINVNLREMRLIIDSDETLPVAKRMDMRKKRAQGLSELQVKNFKDYTFDNRMWSEPVMDLSLVRGTSVSKFGEDGQRNSSFDSYSISTAMLFAGMDASMYMFGDSGVGNRQPRTRISASRTLLEEPRNEMNLTKFQVGDTAGVNRGYFTNANVGRGIQASSFKDLVLSANRTIDITGPLLDGWEVELYLNEQLIGFRQRGAAGRYEFLAIPVSYGLNAFRLVFYGPYGEIKTEDRRYYSGTSPVATGEFGYNFSAFQPNRYIFESNEPHASDESTPIVDTTVYYGVSDRFTTMAGLTTTPDVKTPSMSRQFGMLGGQFIWQGLSLQYNTEYGFANQAIGHHFEAQGNVYVGNILTRYENYGNLYSPASYQKGKYLKDIFETRFSGNLPIVGFPWFISYSEMRSREDDKDSTTSFRVSPKLGGVGFSIDNTWHSNSWDNSQPTNELTVNAYKTFNPVHTNLYAIYRTHPDRYCSELGGRVDWRLNKYTYANMYVTRLNRSAYSNQSDLNSLSVSGGRIFPFGGITLDTKIDSDRNASVMLRYNIGIGKNPARRDFVTSAQGKLSERGSALVQTIDESKQPVPGVKVSASGSSIPVVTDENGEAIITDLPTYGRTMFFIDMETLPDVSLVPENEKYKHVMRPGTILPIKMRFSHLGAVEGQIKNGGGSVMGYTVRVRDKDGNVKAETYTDFEGFFILDAVLFGEYELVISRGEETVYSEEIQLKDVVYSIPQPIAVSPPDGVSRSTADDSGEQIPTDEQVFTYEQKDITGQVATDEDQIVADEQIPIDEQISTVEHLPIDEQVSIDEQMFTVEQASVDEQITIHEQVSAEGQMSPADEQISGIEKIPIDEQIAIDAQMLTDEQMPLDDQMWFT